MIEGNVSLDELMSRLITAQETYQSQLVLEIKDEGERAARDAVKREQDLAFEMSLVVRYHQCSLLFAFFFKNSSISVIKLKYLIELSKINMAMHSGGSRKRSNQKTRRGTTA